MTNQQHPIIPPPDKIHNWLQLEKIGYTIEQIITAAAQYGADQELEACCKWLEQNQGRWEIPMALRAARRPKPPSLKKQALQELEQLRGDANSMGMGFDAPAIRRALNQLPDS